MRPQPANEGGRSITFGFEVKTWPLSAKKLKAKGVKFEEPFSPSRQTSMDYAHSSTNGALASMLTDKANRLFELHTFASSFLLKRPGFLTSKRNVIERPAFRGRLGSACAVHLINFTPGRRQSSRA